jgi:hypothetical protein
MSDTRTKDQDYAYCRKYPGCGCFVGCVEMAWEDLAMREANRTSDQLCPCGCGWSVEGHKLWAEAKAREQPPSKEELDKRVADQLESICAMIDSLADKEQRPSNPSSDSARLAEAERVLAAIANTGQGMRPADRKQFMSGFVSREIRLARDYFAARAADETEPKP